MSLHPAFQSYLDELNPLVEQAAKDGVVATVESTRAALARLNAFALPDRPVARCFDAVVAGEPAVPVRVYVPRPDTASDVILFVHGGGHMAGDLDVYDFSARRVAEATGMVVVSVDYRRSPETLFPGGLLDVHHVAHNLDEVLDGEATTGHVHAFADSGGAAKVASLAMRVAADEWGSPIERQVLLYPSLDYTMSGASMRNLASGFFLSADRVRWHFDHYFPEGVDRKAHSPMFGPFTVDLPDTLVIAAEYDPLRSEAESYVERMQRAGATAHLLIAPGMIHAFAFFEQKVPEAIGRFTEVSAEFLRTGAVPAGW